MLLSMLIAGCNNTDDVAGTDDQGEWKLVYESHDQLYYQGLHFVDIHNGWVVGDSGVIVHTTDGGFSWDTQESGTAVSLRTVFFVNTKKGWVGGGSDSVGRTTDGGATWMWVRPAGEPRRTFMAMSFVNENTGWVVDNVGGILHTDDGGRTWLAQASGTTWAITAIQFLDVKEGWATATNRVVLHTTDGGAAWITQMLDTINYGSGVTAIYTDVFFRDHSSGWIPTNVMASSIANPMASVVATSNAGRTWSRQLTPDENGLTTLQFVNQNRGWAGSYGGILLTTNGGNSWEYHLRKKDGDPVVDLYFVDESHGWALTFRGNIYTYQGL
jgi:photosystem II stability/assembly factor-like uncharacterized protein